MPSSFTHAVAAVALGRAYTTRRLPLRFWVLSAGCAMAPDMDVVCSRFGIEYTHMLGHRGITHSFLFAAVLAGLLVLLAFRKPIEGISRWTIFALFFLATISHAVLDAMVDGTLGVALFAPFSAERYFLPFRPIVSSPVGWGFFSYAGALVLMNEFVWLWIPSLLIIFAPWLRRYTVSKRRAAKARPALASGGAAQPPLLGLHVPEDCGADDQGEGEVAQR
ncbi:MAG TPA: metal-dependent hydrolase [Blastocatellia bacterium]|nr:metal-dependent hydrolase [Blastocatellia bacterium]